MDKANVHVLVVPLPTQGHLGPIMQLLHRLADNGLMITILTTEGPHAGRIIKEHSRNEFKIVTVPDGLETEDERKDVMKVLQSFFRVMPGHTLNFIKNVNDQSQNGQKIGCAISDVSNTWCLEIARKMGLKMAVFNPLAIGCMATWLKVSDLIKAGIIDAQGFSNKNEEILQSPYLPAMSHVDYPWILPGNLFAQKRYFKTILGFEQCLRGCDWVLGNWFRDLDPSADNLLPNILSIGPLISSSGRSPSGSLWSQDLSCLSWLDKQPPGSVIYVAFGTTGGEKRKQQFHELALGLELIGKPFLWVVKMNPSDGVATNYPDGFEERVGNRGKMVEWAPQEQVLAHPSVACFLFHAGWNSTLESIWNGVPMICWAYMSDQLYNRTCICYGWKIGLELKPDENEIVTRELVKMKVEELLSNAGIKSNVMKLKGLARKSISKGGSSTKNLEDFVAQLKQLSV